MFVVYDTFINQKKSFTIWIYSVKKRKDTYVTGVSQVDVCGIVQYSDVTF